MVQFHRLALDEYLKARRYYQVRSVALGEDFAAAIDESIGLVERNPAIGRPYGPRFRWVRTRKFPYLLYYACNSVGRIVVYAVAHARRKPGYWMRRVRS